MRNLLFGDREFYKTLVRLAIPIALQNLIASSLNMVDTIMIGQLGETEIAAVGLANQVFFLLILFMFGVNSGSSIFTAQFWGKRDIPNIRKVLGLSLISGISVAFLFFLIAFFMPRQVLGIFTKDQQVILLGARYLKIVCFSYVLTAISFSYSFILRSTEQVKLPMKVSVIALGLNTFFNYLLIFGHLGLPAMGVEGAAIATLISRIVEIVLILVVVYRKKYAPAARIKEMLNISFSFVKKFYSTTIPVIANEGLWSLGVTMYSVVYARMGTGVIASANISSTVERIAMVLFVGIANACAVMVGNRIGENEDEKAFVYAKRLSVLGPAVGICMGILLILTSRWILSLYNVSQSVLDGAHSILFIFACIMPFKIFNMINIVGILRSGGDTKFSLFIDTAGIWFIALPLSALGGLVWGLPLYMVYIFISFEEVFKFVLGVRRFISKKWINNLVNHM